MTPAQFDALLADFLAHAAARDLFVQDLIGGADRAISLPTRVVTEYAWHSLFIRNLLIRPDAAELARFVPKMTIIDLPSFRADPARHGCTQRDGDRRRPDPHDRADRRHLLCRRDEEVGVHRAQLPPARQAA